MKNAHRAIGFVAACVVLSACSSGPAIYAVNASPCPIRLPIAAARWVETSNRGEIEGRVRQIEALTDTSDRALSDAEVSVSGPVDQSATVDHDGNFHLVNLPAGRYAVTVRHDGFPTRHDFLDIGSTGVAGDIRLRRDVHHPACAAPRQMTTQAPEHR
jgi:hypothetical protein